MTQNIKIIELFGINGFLENYTIKILCEKIRTIAKQAKVLFGRDTLQ